MRSADGLSGGRALLAPTLAVFAVKGEMVPGEALRQERSDEDGTGTCAGSAER